MIGAEYHLEKYISVKTYQVNDTGLLVSYFYFS